MVFCANIFLRELICRGGQLRTSRPSPTPSTTVLEKSLDGKLPPKSLANNYTRYNNPVLHRPIERAQYTSVTLTERLRLEDIAASIGSVGDAYDNALAETINGLYKAEVIHRRGPWKTKQAVELATLEWVAWFNHHRLMAPLGYLPPAEFEANYHRQRAGQAATV